MIDEAKLWQELREITAGKRNSEKEMSWSFLNAFLDVMEYNQRIQRFSSVSLSDEQIELLILLEKMGNENSHNCYDFMSELYYDSIENLYRISIFTNPLGIIRFQGKQLDATLSLLYKLYGSQPNEMGVKKAGSHLHDYQEACGGVISLDDLSSDLSFFWKNETATIR